MCARGPHLQPARDAVRLPSASLTRAFLRIRQVEPSSAVLVLSCSRFVANPPAALVGCKTLPSAVVTSLPPPPLCPPRNVLDALHSQRRPYPLPVMDMPGAWPRSTYPLQLSSGGSAHPSPEGTQTLALDRLPDDARDSNDAAARYPPDIRERLGRTSTASQPPADSRLSSHQPAHNSSPYDQSLTGLSYQTSAGSRGGQLRSREAEAIPPSIQLPGSGGIQASPESGNWTGNTYPPHATTQFPKERPLSSSSLASEGPNEPIPVELQPDPSPARNTTLRRTSRSRRIDSPALTSVRGEAVAQAQLNSDTRSTAASGMDPWKRQIYPLQYISPARPSAEDPGHAEKHQRDSSAGSRIDRQDDLSPSPISGSTALAASPHLSENESDNVSRPSLHRLQHNDRSVKESKPWRPQKYPLQAPASIADLRDSLNTPPPRESDSEHLDKTQTSRAQNHGQPNKENKPWPRQSYPLQAPASNPNLGNSFTRATQEEPEQIEEPHTRQLLNGIQATKESKPWHRQRYPLQAPASNMDLRASPTTTLPEEREAATSGETPTHKSGSNSQATNQSKQWHRQKYPLQAPASNTNIRDCLTPPPSPGRQPEDTVKHDTTANQTRENALASEVVNQWRRQVYPVQSPENTSHFWREPTPQPPEAEARKEDKNGPVQLPKNIPALKDAEKHVRKGRTIVVCLDGTGDKFDNDNSNIVHLISALKKDDARQVTYYQAGVGTYGAGGLSGGVTAAMDMAVGSSLGLHVRDAYRFLMHAYKEGDKVCIFGFSRGAYTARCLAGMIHKVGLLPPRNIQQISFAYEFYANDTPAGWKQSEDFKKTFCIDICVYFLGCFDSVASVGFIPRQLPLSSTPSNKPRYFRHAMALDERRAKFKICRHQTKDWKDIKMSASTADQTDTPAKSKISHLLPKHSQDDEPPKGSSQMESAEINHPNITDEEYQRLTAHEAPFDTDVLEVWFTGAHADIGGGAVPNDERHKLAQIPLRWMIRQTFECDTGIIFKTAVLAEHGLDVHTLWPKYEKLSVPAHGPPPSFLERYEQGLPPKSTRRSKLVPIDKHEGGEHFFHLKSHTDEDWTPEQVEDFYDAMSPLNDQLIQAPTWWILELWPVQYKVPTTPGEASTRTGMNLGRYRGVEDAEPNLHWTVLHRVQHTNYKIEARTTPRTKWRTVV